MGYPDYNPNSAKQMQVSPADPVELFQSNYFTINKLQDWQDKTVYIFHGPVTNGIQHNITINIDHEPQLENLQDYADWQIHSVEEQLQSCRLLLHDEVQLHNGLPAVREVFSWFPTDDLRIYQEQLYVMVDGKAFTLTASFTKKTRKTLGPQVERMLLSFAPQANSTE